MSSPPARDMEDAIGVLRQAWTGEPFEHRGVTVRVTPRPVQRPGPPILIGGSVEASARHAARIGDGYEPATPRAHEDVYRSECARLGKDPGPPLPPRLTVPFLHVAEDPEAAWHAIAPHALHEMNAYGAMQVGTAAPMFTPVADDLARLRASGSFQVVTPEECVGMLRPLGPSAEVRLHPLMSGLEPELSWSSLELFVDRVLPRLV